MRLTITALLFSSFLGLALAGCAANGAPSSGDEPVSEAQQALSAYDVQTIYYSDDTFETEVGGTELFCGGGRHTWGTKSAFSAQFQDPCDEGGMFQISCTECTMVGSAGWDCERVECPPGLTFPY